MAHRNIQRRTPQTLNLSAGAADQTQKRSSYQVVTDQILALLEKGDVPWRKPWVGAERPRNLATRKPYRGINWLILGASPFASPYWCTFRQALELGGHVKRGSKSTPIVFYKRLDEKAGAGESEDGDGYRFVLRRFSVFNGEQLEGIEIPEPERKRTHEHPPIERAEAIARGFVPGPSVRHGGDRACYQPLLDLVKMPERWQFESGEEYYSTLFHELAHATGHASRLARKGVTDPTSFGDHAYSHEELIAEITAAMLCGEAEIAAQTLENSAAYLAGWMRTLRGDARMVVTAAGAAQRAADLILGRSAAAESASA